MGNSARTEAKRELDRAVGNLEWVDKHLAAVFNQTIEGHHDKLRDWLTTAGAINEELKNLIQRINASM